jgi:protein-ribulosamine 3-kinase
MPSGIPGHFVFPRYFSWISYEDDAFLVMEFIEEGPKGTHFWQNFGKQLAVLHRCSNEKFGYSRNNYIGSLDQSNSWTTEWVRFFIEQRLEPQLRLAEKLLSPADYRSFEKLFHRLEKLIPVEAPALLHGDLWGGNYLADEMGQPVLIDPAVYYGHREVDLAMMNLFGGFDSKVFEYYHREFPLEGGWKDRMGLHNLYPLLVHVNLFGGSYLQSVRSNLRRYL